MATRVLVPVQALNIDKNNAKTDIGQACFLHLPDEVRRSKMCSSFIDLPLCVCVSVSKRAG